MLTRQPFRMLTLMRLPLKGTDLPDKIPGHRKDLPKAIFRTTPHIQKYPSLIFCSSFPFAIAQKKLRRDKDPKISGFTGPREFVEMRTSPEELYIDKSKLLEEIVLKGRPFILLEPRRCGKTLTLEMFQEFYCVIVD